MNLKEDLKKLAKDFNLKYPKKGHFNFLKLSKREIIIRNFLSTCPDPIYLKFKKKRNKKIGEALIDFLNSKNYQEDMESQHGCVISHYEIKNEIEIVKRIKDQKVRKEIKKTYARIRKLIKKGKRLTLIQEDLIEKDYKHILLHEFIHELMEYNNIRPKSWEWNEGLVTYLTHFSEGTINRFIEKPKPKKSKMWNIYARYTHKWTILLEGINSPKERRKIIESKIREIDKKSAMTE